MSGSHQKKSKSTARIANIARSDEEALGASIFVTGKELKSLNVDIKEYDKVRYSVDENLEILSIREEV